MINIPTIQRSHLSSLGGQVWYWKITTNFKYPPKHCEFPQQTCMTQYYLSQSQFVLNVIWTLPKIGLLSRHRVQSYASITTKGVYNFYFLSISFLSNTKQTKDVNPAFHTSGIRNFSKTKKICLPWHNQSRRIEIATSKYGTIIENDSDTNLQVYYNYVEYFRYVNTNSLKHIFRWRFDHFNVTLNPS